LLFSLCRPNRSPVAESANENWPNRFGEVDWAPARGRLLLSVTLDLS